MNAPLSKSTPIPQDFVDIYSELHARGWSPWTTPVAAVQADVDTFVELFRDRNPIHAAHSKRPIVPALFTFASLTRYLEQEGDIISFPGHVTVIEVFKELRFTSFVPVGSQLSMRFRPLGMDRDQVGIFANAEIEIRAEGKTRNAVQGIMCLRFISHRVYDMLIARA